MKKLNRNILGRAKKIVTLTAASTQLANMFAPVVLHAAPRVPIAAPAMLSSVTEITYSPSLIYSLSSFSRLELLNYSPVSSGISAQSDFWLSFNEEVSLGDGTITIHRSNDDTVEQIFTISSGSVYGASVSFSGNNVFIDPNADLQDNTTYYINISSGAFISSQGALFSGISPYQWSFTTGDFTAPTLLSTPPSSDKTSLYGPYSFIFNEDVRLGEGKIQFFKQGNSFPAVTISIANNHVNNAYFDQYSGNIIHFYPHFELDEDTNYYVHITSGTFVDLKNNPFAGLFDSTFWSFTTLDKKPYLTNYTPSFASGVPTDTNFTFYFSEPVQLNNGSISLIRSDDTSIAQQFVISNGVIQGASVFFSGNAMTLDPDLDLEDSTSYYIDISSGAVIDLKGNLFSGFYHFTWNFTTGDFNPPILTSTLPTSNSANLEGPFSLIFNESMQFGHGEIQFYKQGESTPAHTISITNDRIYNAFVQINSGHAFAFYPSFSLEQDTDYYVLVTSGAFVDLSNNPFAGLLDSTLWNFTTLDEKPYLIDYTPARVAGVPLDTDFTFYFSEPVQLNNGSIFLHRSDDASIAQQFVISNGVIQGASVSFSGNAMTLDPDLDLEDSTSYYIDISSGAVIDLKGNPFSGFYRYFWSFTAEDFTPPTLTSVRPMSANVSLQGLLSLSFTEPTQLGHGEIQFFKQGVSTSVHTISIRNGKIYNASFTKTSSQDFTLYPSFKLEQDTDYYVLVTSGAFVDSSNNPFAGLLDSTVWNFTTVDEKPYLTNYTPSFVSDVPIDTNLSFHFTEPVQLNSGVISLIRLNDESVAQQFVISNGVIQDASVSFSGNAMTLDPDQDLEEFTSYYIDISSGAFIDLKGNSFSGFYHFKWSFMTKDLTPPAIISISPTHDNVGLNGPFSLVFDEPVRLGEGKIQIFKKGTSIPTEIISVANNNADTAYFEQPLGNVFNFNLYSRITNDTDFYVTITSGTFMDLNNNPFPGLLNSTEWNFTTLNLAPYVYAFNWDSFQNVPVDSDLTFFYSENALPYNGTISLVRLADDSVAQQFVISSGGFHDESIFFSGNALTLRPQMNLEDATTYYINISSGLVIDTKGKASNESLKNWRFTTEDAAPPKIVSVGMDDGAQLNGPYSIAFNENIQLGYGNIYFYKQGETTPAHTITISGTHVYNASLNLISGRFANFYTDFELEQDTSYYVHITSGTFVDLSNKPFAGLLDSTSWSFTTLDKKPKLINYSPNAIANVPTDTDFTFYFSEPVQLNNGSISLIRLNDKSVAQQFVISNGVIQDASVSFSGNAMFLDPDSDLEDSTLYYIDISSGAVIDLKGNPFSGFYHFQWDFMTGDFNPPKIVSAGMDDGAQLNGPYSIAFNENIQLGYGNIYFYKQGETTPAHTITISGTHVYNASLNLISGRFANFYTDFELEQDTSYYVHITSGTFVDLSNKPFAGLLDSTSWSFTTLDKKPKLINYSPNAIANVPTDTDFTFYFSEPVQLNNGSISLIRLNDKSVAQQFVISNGVIQDASVSFSGNAMFLDPDSDLEDSTLYYIDISSGAVIDLKGNPFSGFYHFQWDFMTGDFNPPKIVFAGMDDGAQLNGPYSIAFNENIQLGYGNIYFYKQGETTPAHTITISGTHVYNASLNLVSGRFANFYTDFELEQDTSYYVHITSGTFVDLSNKPFAGLLDSTSWSFTTLDKKPKLINYSPNAIANVPTDTDFTFYFSEPVQLNNGSISLIRLNDKSVAQQFVISNGVIQDASVSFSGNAMFLDPDSDLEDSTLYYIDISSGAVIDLKGNPFSGFYHFQWDFMTGDFNPPKIVFAGMDDGAQLNGPYSIAFNENIQLGYGNIYFYKQGETTPAHTITISGTHVYNASLNLVSGRFANFYTDFELEQDTSYYVHITSGTFVDLSNKPFAGLLDSTSWSFTTLDKKPKLINYSPNAIANVPTDTDFTFYFSEPVQLNNGSISLIRLNDKSVAQQFVISNGVIQDASVSFSGNAMFLDPDSDLEDSTLYYIDISSGAVIDLKGNPFSGFYHFQWDFMTGDFNPPKIVFAGMDDGAQLNGPYSIAFNENIQLGYGNIYFYKQGETTPAHTITISGTHVYNASLNLVSGRFANFYTDFELEQDTSYYVHITSGTFVDLSNKPFAGLLDSTSWSFTTVDRAAFLQYMYPYALSGIAVDTNFTFDFSEPVELSNGTISIIRSQNNTVAQQFTISNGQINNAVVSFSGKTMTLDPTIDLEGSTSYYVIISSGAFIDLKGNPLSGLPNLNWSFTTAAQSNTGGSNGNSGSNQPSQPTVSTPTIPAVVAPNEAAPVISNSPQVNVITAPFKAGKEHSITLPANQSGSAALVYYYDDKYKQWIALPTQHDGNTLTANMPPESWVAVMDNPAVYQPVDTVSNWANEDIMKLMSLNIIQGYEDQTFKPNQVTNRYEMAVMVAKVLGLPMASTDVTALNTLPDSDSIPEWAKPAVAALVQNNIMLGSAQGFQGSESITRAQLAAMLGRILPAAQNNTAPSFKDQSTIPAWASDGIQKAIELGIFKGYPDGSFQPDKTLTRAEMAAVITRLMDYLIQQPKQ
ncbi:Ig-like domain-containing protein [Paenibacillus sp. KS-LC4]|uniref:Ig-like domain-containing protein n=1 Tax=Paenibacillus sp. KS-LC4 TaxID=2979727 RepID=UPI0030CECCEC